MLAGQPSGQLGSGVCTSPRAEGGSQGGPGIDCFHPCRGLPGITAQQAPRLEALHDTYRSVRPVRLLGSRLPCTIHGHPPPGPQPLEAWLWFLFLENNEKLNSSHSAATGQEPNSNGLTPEKAEIC